MTQAFSGRDSADITTAAARNGELQLDDIRISRETLLHQAERAEASGSAQLGANFRRAAELTQLSSQDMLEVYESLRPGRSSFQELIALAERFQDMGAPECARLVSEAAHAYQRRGLLR